MSTLDNLFQVETFLNSFVRWHRPLSNESNTYEWFLAQVRSHSSHHSLEIMSLDKFILLVGKPQPWKIISGRLVAAWVTVQCKYVCVCIHVFVCVYMCVYIHVCVCVYTYMCVFVCIHTCVCTCCVQLSYYTFQAQIRLWFTSESSTGATGSKPVTTLHGYSVSRVSAAHTSV